MTTTVAVTTVEVNRSTGYRCSCAVPPSAVGLLERISWVIESGRVKSARDWAITAGLSGNYIGTLTTRLRKPVKPGKDIPDAKRDEIVKLARAAHVTIEWLADGEGDPDALPPDAANVSPEMARSFARRSSLRLGVREEAIRRVDRAMGPKATGDARWWVRQYMNEDERIDRGAESTDNDGPPAPESSTKGPLLPHDRDSEVLIISTKRPSLPPAPAPPAGRAARKRSGK